MRLKAQFEYLIACNSKNLAGFDGFAFAENKEYAKMGQVYFLLSNERSSDIAGLGVLAGGQMATTTLKADRLLAWPAMLCTEQVN